MQDSKETGDVDNETAERLPAGLPAFDSRTNFSILGWILDRFGKGDGNEQQVDLTLD